MRSNATINVKNNLTIGEVICVHNKGHSIYHTKHLWYPAVVLSVKRDNTSTTNIINDNGDLIVKVKSFYDDNCYIIGKDNITLFNRIFFEANYHKFSTNSDLQPSIGKALKFLISGLMPPNWDNSINLYEVIDDSSDESVENDDLFAFD